jgi:hypothetical protein
VTYLSVLIFWVLSKEELKKFDNFWVTKTSIESIESIQKKYLLFALRHLYYPQDYNRLPSYEDRLPSYEDRLKIIYLEKICLSRKNASAIFIFNILHGGISRTFKRKCF